jgi:hypothetical protein
VGVHAGDHEPPPGKHTVFDPEVVHGPVQKKLHSWRVADSGYTLGGESKGRGWRKKVGLSLRSLVRMVWGLEIERGENPEFPKTLKVLRRSSPPKWSDHVASL